MLIVRETSQERNTKSPLMNMKAMTMSKRRSLSRRKKKINKRSETVSLTPSHWVSLDHPNLPTPECTESRPPPATSIDDASDGWEDEEVPSKPKKVPTLAVHHEGS